MYFINEAKTRHLLCGPKAIKAISYLIVFELSGSTIIFLVYVCEVFY